MKTKLLIFAATSLLWTVQSRADSSSNAKKGGLLTQIKGQVQIFKNPGPKPSGDGMHILYEGLYYLAEPAQVGRRVQEGNVIHTAGNASARIVYGNGDQITVGPSSSVKILFQQQKSDTTELDVIYGKMRAVVNRASANTKRNFRVITPSATAGVRGTDFAVAYDPADAKADISVLRGKVDVQPQGGTETHALETGMTAKVIHPQNAELPPPQKEAPPSAQGATPAEATLPTGTKAPMVSTQTDSAPAVIKRQPAPTIEIKKITQEALGDIQKFSYSKPAPQDVATLAPEVAKEVQATEDVATQKTLQSIKIEAPELFKKLETQKVSSTSEINSLVVGKLMQEAPREPTPQKKLQQELKELDEDIYNKYFRKE